MTAVQKWTQEAFDIALEMWLERAQKIVSSHIRANFKMLSIPTLQIDPNGKKYIRIVKEGSVYCFIDKSNGDVLKAVSWKAPAKHARGNIYKIGNEGVDQYGAHYLR